MCIRDSNRGTGAFCYKMGDSPTGNGTLYFMNPLNKDCLLYTSVGDGCKWRKCRFCDYHLDSSLDIENNYKINKEALGHITGIYKKLEVINSGSFVDLDDKTIKLIKDICLDRGINAVSYTHLRDFLEQSLEKRQEK